LSHEIVRPGLAAPQSPAPPSGLRASAEPCGGTVHAGALPS
jgi:hypothetical protein